MGLGGSVKPGAVLGVVVALVAAGVLGWALRGQGTAATPSTGASGSSVGPTRELDGIPVGYAHSEQGAIAAAAGYARAVVAAMPAGRLQTALNVLTVPPLSEQARSKAAQLAAGERLMTGSLRFMRVWPLGYRVDSYSPIATRVRLWSYGVGIAERPHTMISDYSVDVLTLRWTGSDWKVATRTPAPSVTPPADGSTNEQALAAFASTATSFEDFAGVP